MTNSYLWKWFVLQAVGAAAIAGLFLMGVADKPFLSGNPFVCGFIAVLLGMGIICALAKRWDDVKWIAIHVVRVGLLGTVVGLIIAFSSAKSASAGDPNEIRGMISAVVDGMYVSLYATLMGVGANLWLKINLRLLGSYYG